MVRLVSILELRNERNERSLMNYGKDDPEMWSVAESDEIRRQATLRGHEFDCECSACTRTKKLEILLREPKVP